MQQLYTLDRDGMLRPIAEWGRWWEWINCEDNRLIRRTEIAPGVAVVTEFWGRNFGTHHAPMYYITWVDGSEAHEDLEKGSGTYHGALETHETIVDLMRYIMRRTTDAR